MNPAQVLSLSYLVGVVLGYFAGAWLPWWIAGLPCYAGAFGAWLVARMDKANTPEQVTAYAAGTLMGACASASVVSMLCTAPHATGAIEGLDVCPAPLLVGLAYAMYVWRDDSVCMPKALRDEMYTESERRAHSVRLSRRMNALAFGLYLASLALAAVMGGM